jgi:hypothetical protein
MFDPATLEAIARAGGWVFAAISLAAAGLLFFRAVASGQLVPGPVHARVLDQNDRLNEAVAKLTGSVDTFATQTTGTLRELRDDVAELRGLARPRRD